jgi:hypothetical protein
MSGDPSDRGCVRDRRRAVRRLALLAVGLLLVAAMPAAGEGAHVSTAVPAGAPNLGAPPKPCSPSAKGCCPGADCLATPAFVTASPFLTETAIGVETISRHLIRVGQKFTLTWHSSDPFAAMWTFPTTWKRLTACKTGVDLTCTYVARARDVTYPARATYDGWSEYSWGAIDHNGPGIGYGYYAIVGPRIPVWGRLADKHGRGIPKGGIQAPPGGGTPDPGVLIEFSVKRRGTLTPIYAAAPSIRGSVGHPYDVGYYGLVVKPGTYTVTAGDPITHVRCTTRRLHVSHAASNFNLRCT